MYMEEEKIQTNSVSLTPSEAVLAAIASALTLLTREMHDPESGVITIRRVAGPNFSPWSDKYYNMNPYKK